ncbi:hypothetical protein EDB81DRAFT_797088 [Dactylonectria macrodidyma]|uniref:gamma-glutamylcyclotransferase n=1 Tax=Dactylonectria macrodidyma TaxID=307937 RepID=A0A9P9ET83_9HYPO|nr:hypothetical protein EDB81DRAFT_797088 [Dactylonectria macrodidyma]
MGSQEDSQQSQDSTMTLMQDNRHEVLYFAYGSNLSTEQMRQRCPYSTPVGLAYLEGWKWFINGRGYANVSQVVSDDGGEYDDGDNQGSSSRAGKGKGKGKGLAGEGVYGLLYLLPPQDEELLDGYEGVPYDYQKYQVDVKWARGDGQDDGEDGSLRALIYVDGEETTEDAPRDEYVGRMERAIEDAVDNWGLDEGYANRVMRRFWKGKNGRWEVTQ